MSKKSGLQRTGDMARHAQAIKKIIQAALRGGWQAAAMEAVKHYWPYILTAAIVLLMLPIIVLPVCRLCCLALEILRRLPLPLPQENSMTAMNGTVMSIYCNCMPRLQSRKAIKRNRRFGKQNGSESQWRKTGLLYFTR